MCLAGYQPDLEGDGGCFDCANGVLTNTKNGRQCIAVSALVRSAMQRICEDSLEGVFRFTLPEADMRALSNATQHYVLAQTGKQFVSLSAYEQFV